VEDYQRIEKHIQQKLEQFPVNQEEVVVMQERVTEAQRFAVAQMKELHSKEKAGTRHGAKHGFKKKSGNKD
jgi:ATP-dependent RNA helicase DDX47/RRP3